MKRLIGLFLVLLVWGCENEKQRSFVEHIVTRKGSVYYHIPTLQHPFKVLFLSDNHFTVEDERGKEYYSFSQRMGGGYVEPENYGISNGREKRLIESLNRAQKDSVDLVVLGGDIINFPSMASVDSIMQIMTMSGLNWRYIAGNHDWHYEGEDGTASEQRNKWEDSVLKPLYQGENPLFYSVVLHKINFIFIDNSTHEITEQQLQFVRSEIEKGMPVVLFMHVPIYFPGQNIDYSCGHPDWNQANDCYYEIERRLPWPQNGHTETTLSFCELVRENPSVIGIFAGHTHMEMIDYYKNKIQYVVGANYNGNDVMIYFQPADSKID